MINLFCNFNEDKKKVIDFILNSSSLTFNICNEDQLNKHMNDNNLFLLSPQTKKSVFEKILFNNSQLQLKNIFYLLPLSFKQSYDNKIKNKAFYPLNFLLFEEQINNFFSQKIFLNDILFISNDNLLTNIESKEKIYLTEIESKIINLLNSNNSVSKDEINEVVLGHKTIIESKSLDTHLYRLRSKLNKVSNNIKIKYDSKKNIKMIIS